MSTPVEGVLRTATILELRRDEQDRSAWQPVDDFAIGRHDPATALSMWLAEHEPATGSYRLQTSDGGRAPVWIAEKDDR